jgi:exodeoxyribonuclease-3
VLVVTWNVNSLKAREAFLAEFLDRVRPDVFALQELKLEDAAVPVSMFTQRGYEVVFTGQKAYNGVLLGSRTPITDVHRGFPGDGGDARLIAGTTNGVRFVCLYCPQGQSATSPKFVFKLDFYEQLRAWVAKLDLTSPIVLLGDMNIAPGPEDIWDPFGMDGETGYHPLEHDEWRKLMALGLHDAVRPHVPAGTYSYWDYRAGSFHKGQGMRIDHVLVTAPLVGRVASAWIDRNERKKKGDLAPSDHAPVGVILRDEPLP